MGALAPGCYARSATYRLQLILTRQLLAADEIAVGKTGVRLLWMAKFVPGFGMLAALVLASVARRKPSIER